MTRNGNPIMETIICMFKSLEYTSGKQKFDMDTFIVENITRYELLYFLCYIINHINSIRENNSCDLIPINRCSQLLEFFYEFNLIDINEAFAYMCSKHVIKLNNDIANYVLYTKLYGHCIPLLLAKTQSDPDFN